MIDDTKTYPRYRWLVLLVGIVGSITFGANLIVLAPILGEVANNLNISLGAASNFFSAYVLMGTIVMILGGGVCDKWGITSAIVVGLLCASVPAFLMPWLGHSYGVVLLLRLIQGAATGFIVTTTGPILALWFPPHERGIGGGLITGALSIGCDLGVVLSPVICQATGSWQTTVALFSSIGWAGIAMALIFTRKTPHAVLVIGSTVKGEKGSMKDFFLSPVTLVATFIVFFGNFMLQPLLNLVPAYFASDVPVGLGFGAIVSGKLSLAVTVVGIFATFAGGVFHDKVAKGDARLPIVVGFLLTGIFAYALLVPFIYSSMNLLVICLILAGWGGMFIYPSANAYVVNNFPPAIAGRMIGLCFGLGGFGGVAGLYFGGLSVAKLGSFQMAITLISMAAGAGVITGFFAKNRGMKNA